MGIIYNRFFPDGNASPLIIPYSDRSKILTYLTYDNFVGGSTAWGSEWPIPMRRVSSGQSAGQANWSQITGDRAIRLSAAANPQYYFDIVDSNLTSFTGGTFYIVCKYSTNNKNPRFYTYNSYSSSLNPAYVFTSGREPGSNFNAWNYGSGYLQLNSLMHNYYNVYAVNYYYDPTARTFDVFAMFNVYTLKWAQQSYSTMYIPVARWRKTEQGNMDIKFLAIVNGKESDDAIIKNVHSIMKYFNINDNRYW